MSLESKRIVVTGMGVVSPLGCGVARYPVPLRSHGECRASGTCPGSTGAAPAISRSCHAKF